MAHIGFDQPLDGIRVLDLSRLLPGPFCSLLLADMGADVIKVEGPPGGDYARWYPPLVGEYGAFFASINRNKRSIALDLKNPDAARLLLRLVERCDVVLESFRPGVAERLGVGYEACTRVNPAIVYCAVTGFGQDGPLARRAGHDLGYLALSGPLEQTGTADGPPVIPGFQLADIAGGALYAATAICSALFQAARTAQGAYLDIAMTEGALSLHLPLHGMLAAGSPPRRGHDMLTGGLPCYRLYTTADQRQLAVAALEPKFWAAFVAAIGLPELAADGLASGPDAQRVIATVQARLAQRPLADWTALLSQIDCCVEPVLTPAEVVEHPQHRARGVFFDIEGPDGQPVPQTATPLTPQAGREIMRPAPRMGEHTREVLLELGLASEEIDHLAESGAVVQHGS